MYSRHSCISILLKILHVISVTVYHEHIHYPWLLLGWIQWHIGWSNDVCNTMCVSTLSVCFYSFRTLYVCIMHIFWLSCLFVNISYSGSEQIHETWIISSMPALCGINSSFCDVRTTYVCVLSVHECTYVHRQANTHPHTCMYTYTHEVMHSIHKH